MKCLIRWVQLSKARRPFKSPIFWWSRQPNHQFQITNFLFQVTKMCCIIHLQFWVWNVYPNWIIQHILVTWNRKIGDFWMLTTDKESKRTKTQQKKIKNRIYSYKMVAKKLISNSWHKISHQKWENNLPEGIFP